MGAGRLAAHSPAAVGGPVHLLSEHLLSVAGLASGFASVFGASDAAHLLGLFHDLGKVSPEFQSYITGRAGFVRRGPPHAVWGAALIYRLFRAGGRWPELALPVLGHHGGLNDRGAAAQTLQAFLQESPESITFMREFLAALDPPLPQIAFPDFGSDEAARELWIRMLFSVLVDADYLDTERHFDLGRSQARSPAPSLVVLRDRLGKAQADLLREVADTPVNRVRREVYEACLAAAALQPGFFRLTVPTGGGKSRSGLAFALEHAVRHGLRRVIVAIPYTSIIEQTAGVYREILGDEAVVEHHSAVPSPPDEGLDDTTLRLRLATENWDAPLVVTTTVQLFESLLGNAPSRARKLHRLAGSVIVLDEAQALPPGLLAPTLSVLRGLVEHFGVSVVLCTATQPAFQDARSLGGVSDNLFREIVPDHERHFEVLRRVRFERRGRPISWAELGAEVRGAGNALVILNSRADALAVLAAVDDGSADVFHLSTLLCAAHRSRVLAEVRERLHGGERPVRLVSTQVVEAGVDLDFPVVFRAVAPLDRIVQAAGRCNREGHLGPAGGRVVVFQPRNGRTPRGPYRVGIEKTRLLLEEPGGVDLGDPALQACYFGALFDAVDTDEREVEACRRDLEFREVARRYRLIDSDTVPVVVPYGESSERLAAWTAAPSRTAWRRLQPFVVNLYRHELSRLEADRKVRRVTEGVYEWLGEYDAVHHRGVVGALQDPSDLTREGGSHG